MPTVLKPINDDALQIENEIENMEFLISGAQGADAAFASGEPSPELAALILEYDNEKARGFTASASGSPEPNVALLNFSALQQLQSHIQAQRHADSLAAARRPQTLAAARAAANGRLEHLRAELEAKMRVPGSATVRLHEINALVAEQEHLDAAVVGRRTELLKVQEFIYSL